MPGILANFASVMDFEITAFYNYTLFAAWVLLFFFGGNLLIAAAPPKTAFRNYARSRKILGVALLLFGLKILLHWIFNFREHTPHIASALNLSCYYMEGILFGMSFISLLDPSYISHRQITGDFSKWGFTTLLLWTGALLLSGVSRLCLLVVGSCIFVADAVRIVVTFFRTYRKAVGEMENYYSDDVYNFVRWLYKSVFGIIFFGLIGSVLAFAPRWVNAIYMFGGIFMFIYIFISFQNYMLYYEVVDEVVKPVEDEPSGTEGIPDIPVAEPSHPEDAAPEEYNTGRLRLETDRWIARGGYRQSGITVGQMATEMSTNRTDMSSFINSEYGCSFSEWVCALRLKEARRLLLEEPETPIEQVAARCGFSSSSYFSKQFTKAMGMSPTRWRKQQDESASDE